MGDSQIARKREREGGREREREREKFKMSIQLPGSGHGEILPMLRSPPCRILSQAASALAVPASRLRVQARRLSAGIQLLSFSFFLSLSFLAIWLSPFSPLLPSFARSLAFPRARAPSLLGPFPQGARVEPVPPPKLKAVSTAQTRARYVAT